MESFRFGNYIQSYNSSENKGFGHIDNFSKAENRAFQ